MTHTSLRRSAPSLIRTAVIVCTHNGGRFIREQLDSIDRQTHRVDEIHIFDWASSDDTVERMRSWLESRDAQGFDATLQSMDSSPGPARSFLYALGQVSRSSDADLIFIADQDDVWAAEKVHAYLAEYRSADSGFDLAFSDVRVMRQSDGNIVNSFYGVRGPYQRPNDHPDRTVLLTNPVIGMTICVRREWLAAVRPAFDLYWVMHDWALVILCWMTGGRFCYIDAPLVTYRQHDHNALGASMSRPLLARARKAGSRVRNLRRQIVSAQAAAVMTNASTAKCHEIAALQGRLAQARILATSEILTFRYKLLLAAALLVF